MDLLRRASVAYYRANVDAWAALRRCLPVIDPWLVAGLAQLAAVLTLVASGYPDTALVVAAASLWLPVFQRLLDR